MNSLLNRETEEIIDKLTKQVQTWLSEMRENHILLY